MVALAQPAIIAPLVLLSLPSDAIADIFDRRRVALIGLRFACASALALTACSLGRAGDALAAARLLAPERTPAPSGLPPEWIDRAIVSGFRHAWPSPPIRVALIGTLSPPRLRVGVGADAAGRARPDRWRRRTYGQLLGANGVGAVLGAIRVSDIRNRFA